MKQEERLTIRITPEALESLDELRRDEKDLPSRAKMIHRLIERARSPRTSAVIGEKRARALKKTADLGRIQP